MYLIGGSDDSSQVFIYNLPLPPSTLCSLGHDWRLEILGEVDEELAVIKDLYSRGPLV